MTIWLNEDEQRVWRAQIAIWRRLQLTMEQRLQAETGVPHTYYIILAMLSEAPQHRLRMSELADVISSSPSRLSHAVSRLCERGLIERQPAADDRRGSLAVLTAAGLELVVRTAPTHVRIVREAMFDLITPDQLATLDEVYAGILARMDGAQVGSAGWA